MLRRPIALAARYRLHTYTALRSIASIPFDKSVADLNNLLDVDENTTASLWGSSHASVAPSSEVDPQLVNPPIGPDGSLPPGSPPSPNDRTKKATAKHDLPKPLQLHLHVFASRNNTILTLTRENYAPIWWISAGVCGFKKVQRSGYEAGYQCAVRMFARIAKEMETAAAGTMLHVSFNGFGFGREAVFRALMASEGDRIRDSVRELKDTTPLKVGGGTRAKKMRRL